VSALSLHINSRTARTLADPTGCRLSDQRRYPANRQEKIPRIDHNRRAWGANAVRRGGPCRIADVRGYPHRRRHPRSPRPVSPSMWSAQAHTRRSRSGVEGTPLACSAVEPPGARYTLQIVLAPGFEVDASPHHVAAHRLANQHLARLR